MFLHIASFYKKSITLISYTLFLCKTFVNISKELINQLKKYYHTDIQYYNYVSYFISINSTSKTKVALAGITPPAPASPYAK